MPKSISTLALNMAAKARELELERLKRKSNPLREFNKNEANFFASKNLSEIEQHLNGLMGSQLTKTGLKNLLLLKEGLKRRRDSTFYRNSVMGTEMKAGQLIAKINEYARKWEKVEKGEASWKKPRK